MSSIFRFSPIEIFTPVAARPPHWAVLDAMLRMLIALFATPALLWLTGFDTGRRAHAFLTQIREAEALARRLLLRDAQSLALTLSPGKRRANRSSARASARAKEMTIDYRAWRVAFRFAPRTIRGHDRRRRPRPTRAEKEWAALMAPVDPIVLDAPDLPPPHLSPRACALRFEALRRLIENPEPFIRRLARRLKAAPRSVSPASMSSEPCDLPANGPPPLPRSSDSS